MADTVKHKLALRFTAANVSEGPQRKEEKSDYIACADINDGTVDNIYNHQKYHMNFYSGQYTSSK